MVLVKTLSIIIHVTITIHVLLKMNLVKKALNCLSIYGTERESFIFSLIGIFLCNHRNMFLDHESVIFLFVSAAHLDPNVCSINLMSLFQNVGKK